MSKEKIRVFVGKSERLTLDIKDDILLSLINKKFVDAFKKQSEEEEKFAEYLYEKFISPYKELLEKVPEHWKKVSNYAKISVKGEGYNSYRYVPYIKAKVVPNTEEEYKNIPQLDPTSKLAETWVKLRRKKSDLDDKKSKLRYEIRATLKTFNTTKQLFSGWPEVYDLYFGENKPLKKESNLPAIQIKDLNSKLGL